MLAADLPDVAQDEPFPDFGRVHGVKWADTNGNGRREGKESGVAGVTIYADVNNNGQLDPDEPATTTSEQRSADECADELCEAGHYWLDQLPMGTYSIREVVPDGFVQTFPGFGVPPHFEDDIPFPIFPGGHVIEVVPGEHSEFEGVDFGNRPLPPTGSIEGFKWRDRNGNGERDADEPGLGGVLVYVDLNNNGHFEAREPHNETFFDDPNTPENELGRYLISNVPVGEHTVREVVPKGFEQTFPNLAAAIESSESGRFGEGTAFDFAATGARSVMADDGAIDVEIDVTVTWPVGCGEIIADQTSHTVIGNHILIDMHGQTVGDSCITVVTPTTQTLTVSGLERGDYTIVGTLHESVRSSTEPVASRTTLGFVAEAQLGAPGFHQVQVEANEVVSNIDFGNRRNVPAGSIHGIKWADLNGNGLREEDEPGLADVTIYLDLNFNFQV